MKNDFTVQFYHQCTSECGISEKCPLQRGLEETAYITDQHDYFAAPPIENQMCVPYPDPEGY